MKTLLMLVALWLGSVTQALLPTWDSAARAHAPVLLSVTLYYAFQTDRALMWIAAVLGGLLQDALGRIPLGYSSVCFCLVGWGVSRLREQIFAREWLVQIVAGALAAAAATLLLALMLQATNLAVLAPAGLALKVGGSAALGAMTTPLVCALLFSAERHLGIAPREESA